MGLGLERYDTCKKYHFVLEAYWLKRRRREMRSHCDGGLKKSPHL
jgi:hypothetical protein